MQWQWRAAVVVVVVCGAALAMLLGGDDRLGLAPTQRPILVVGGTGIQGRAALETLYELGFRNLRTLSRNASSEAAQALHDKLQVTVIQGSLENTTALEWALQGCAATFLVTFTNFHDDDGERQTGRRLLNAATAAHVPHIVWSSGSRTGVRWMDAKADLEEYAATRPFASLLAIRSGFFYENLIIKGGQQRFSVSTQPQASDQPHQHKEKEGRRGQQQQQQSQKQKGAGLDARPPTVSQQARPVIDLYSPFPADYAVPMHAASDVGWFAAQEIAHHLHCASTWQTLIITTLKRLQRALEQLALSRPEEGEHKQTQRQRERGREYRTVRLVGDVVSGNHFCHELQRTLLQSFNTSVVCKYNTVDPDELERIMPAPAGPKIAHMYRLVLNGALSHLHSQEAIRAARESAPDALSLSEWLRREGAPIVVNALTQAQGEASNRRKKT